MAETWETLLVRAEAGRTPQFVLVPPQPGIDTQQAPSYDTTVTLLNQLGHEGWRLVNADMSDNSARTGVYWLTRRTPEKAEPGYAFGI